MRENWGTRWHRELIYMSLAMMEVCWVYPWLRLLLGGREQGVWRFITLLAMLLTALYTTRYFDLGKATVKTQRLVTVLLSVLETLLLLRIWVYPMYVVGDWQWLVEFGRDISNVLQRIPSALMVFLVGLYMWWRGITLAQRDLDVDEAGFSFRVGIMAFFWLFVVQTFAPHVEARAYVLAFLGVGLIAMGLSRVQDITQSQEGIRSPFGVSWLGILLTSALVVASVGFLSSVVVSMHTLARVMHWLNPVWRVLARVASPFAAVLAWLLQIILTALMAAFGRLLGAQDIKSESIAQWTAQLQEWQQAHVLQTRLPLVFQIFKWGFLALLLSGVLIGIVFSISRSRRAQVPEDALLVSEWGGASLSEDKAEEASRWERLWGGVRARLASLRGEEYALATIRQMYASLVKLAAFEGFPRQQAETPYEYVATLQRAFPESPEEVALITEAYVRTHYGEQRFERDYVERVRIAWMAIRDRHQMVQRA
jgi:hypothetical protein